MNIFVAKLNYNTTSEELRGVFEEYGEVSSASVITDKFTGKSRGFGFVEMEDADAKKAINELNDTVLDGNTIVVKEATPKGDRGDRGPRSGGGGRNFNRW